MCGHILGLGDRHLENILMDTVTGECVRFLFFITLLLFFFNDRNDRFTLILIVYSIRVLV